MRNRRYGGRRWLGALVAAGACGAGEAGEPRGPVALVAVDTLVTTASELIGGVYDLDVSPSGVLYVADYGYKHVLAVAPAGSTRAIGREGTGPGEFGMPYIVGAGDDTVRAFDPTSGLIQLFDTAGTYLRGYRADAPGLGGSRDFADDGTMAVTIGGFEDALVLVLAPDGSRVATVGDPIVPPTQFYDFGAIKAEIRDGQVPDALRNQALVAWGPDRSLYLAFLADPEVRRYAADGTLLWSRTLDEPVLAAARERFFRLNLEEQSPARLHPLRYVADLGTRDGHLWLLLNTPEAPDGLLLELDRDDGTTRRRIVFPGFPSARALALDERRGRLYMAPGDDASILVFDLPE